MFLRKEFNSTGILEDLKTAVPTGYQLNINWIPTGYQWISTGYQWRPVATNLATKWRPERNRLDTQWRPYGSSVDQEKKIIY